jgi:phytol kinase
MVAVNPVLGLGLSFAFVFAVLGVGMALLRFGVVDAFVSRKIIHIGVGHWWFFYLYLIQDPLWGLVGPVFFVIFNVLARQFGFLKAMEPGKGESNLGTIYFPISLIAMVLWSGWGGLPLWVAGAGVLVLSWGDGLAALTGKAWGRHPLPVRWSHKSWEGTVALLVATAVVVLAFLAAFAQPMGADLSWWFLAAGKASVIAVAVALVEALTPFGIDNLLLPFVTSGLLWVLV